MSRPSAIGDPEKAKEAKAQFEQGAKALATSAFKWKPDFLTAEPHFKNAGRLYKAAGMNDSALEALRKAVHCAVKMGNLKQAASTLESTAREWSLLPGRGKETASELYSEAATYLADAGETVRAADVLLLAGKQLEATDKERAAKLFDGAAALFDGHDDKDVYAVQPLQKVLREQLNVGKHASAMRTIEKLMKIYTRLAQPHNVYKALLSRVVLLLAAADPVAAQREFELSLDVTGYAASDEAGAAEDLIGCYTEVNPEALKTVAARNVINYLDPPVAKLAKGLSAALLTGSSFGAAHAGEAATAAVAPAAAAQAAGPAGFREFGGAVGRAVAIGGGTAGAAPMGGSAAAAADAEDSAATARARKEADRAAVDRSALFSKPAGSSSGGAGGSARGKALAAAPAPAEDIDEYLGGGAKGAGAGGAPAMSGDEAAGADDDYDYERAFADMHAGGADDEPPRSAAEPVRAAAAAAEDDDLGIL